MSIESFIHDPKVVQAIQGLKEQNLVVSDMVDEQGHQYVDLVLEGGGTLGVALLGYTYALEQVGVRFRCIAGTSAGAINAMALAAVGHPEEAKTPQIIEYLANMPMREFVDGGKTARKLVDAYINQASSWTLGWYAARVLSEVREHLGLNPGKRFHDWVKEILAGNGVQTLADLEQQTRLHGVFVRDTHEPVADIPLVDKLKLIAADVTTETKVVFPEMAPIYYQQPEQVNPADFVRASMSVPYFFRPVVLGDIPSNPQAIADWERLAGYQRSNVPEQVTLVDGGIMSNFPISAFHSATLKKPRAPTFGVKLGADRANAHKIDNLSSLALSMFASTRHYADFDFLHRNPDYKQLVTVIDTADINWLNFDMPLSEKVMLFRLGVEAACQFVAEFDWRQYQRQREQVAASNPAH